HQGRGLSFELGGKRTSLLAHQTPLSRRGFSPKSVSGISRPLHWEALVGKVVGIEDEKSHEFAALKSLFKRKRYSYDTLEMREPGDHSNWLRGRDGDEGITNEVTSIHGLKELSELEI
ncbi:hypothetical protein I5J08_32180, partial [Pseudomonas aeruginosa]|nr:hypothetical protein [Pseudomonas aeruginosa]MBG6857561.1 hypothetical protein [Pseudomonas aeruginosa]MBG7016131.1 hypothetical protein [Pseudomonas aeruginosa]MBG7202556.1 hypothetical protein [Pseudomonas aeruginosa]MBG7417475.1 hypothetical protein [Pseudomonas aeruginosa]